LIRKQAIKIIAKRISSEPIVAANGYVSRDLFAVSDNKSNFYMIGSMGLASSIALGISLKKPKRKIFVFDGDGNILMNLGSLTTIGALQPKNLVHVIFDNSSHDSTGGQPTNTKKISLDKIGKSANYKHVFKTSSATKLTKIIDKIMNLSGPIMILVKIQKTKKTSKRVSFKPTLIKDRFMKTLSK